jgi:hypothetical protein
VIAHSCEDEFSVATVTVPDAVEPNSVETPTDKTAASSSPYVIQLDERLQVVLDRAGATVTARAAAVEVA